MFRLLYYFMTILSSSKTLCSNCIRVYLIMYCIQFITCEVYFMIFFLFIILLLCISKVRQPLLYVKVNFRFEINSWSVRNLYIIYRWRSNRTLWYKTPVKTHKVIFYNFKIKSEIIALKLMFWSWQLMSYSNP